MATLEGYLSKRKVVVIMRDAENASGFPFLKYTNLHLITNTSDAGRILSRTFPNQIHLITETHTLDTPDLLVHPSTINCIDEDIVVFKNTPQIERIAEKHGWSIKNPPAELTKQIEEKINQASWLGEDASLLPAHTICSLKDIAWEQTPFIIQYNHAHSGEGTQYISTEEELTLLQKQFPDRIVKKSLFIKGSVYTSNVVIDTEHIYTGTVSYQITGRMPHTDLAFATIGNDWSFADTQLSPKQKEDYATIQERIGKKLQKSGWCGIAGIDMILDYTSNNFVLIEINARQTANVSMESLHTQGHTILETHLETLLHVQSLPPQKNIKGAQLIARITKENQSAFPEKKLHMPYLRIYSPSSVMEQENVLLPTYRAPLHVQTLPEKVEEMIDAYTHIPVGNVYINTPYINNRRQGIRGGLRVAIGKGTPKEIRDEIKLSLQKHHIEVQNDPIILKKHIISTGIGIDCSGFVYHVLSAYRSMHISFPYAKSLLGRIRARLRPAMNANVKTLAHDNNSTVIPLTDAQPGDIITMTHASPEKEKEDHILLITKVVSIGHVPYIIYYTHAKRWQKDDTFNHGIRMGEIRVTDSTTGITEQLWTEDAVSGDMNDTYIQAKGAYTEIRRLHI